MKLLEKNPWPVVLNYFMSTSVFLFTFAAMQHADFVQEYIATIWSLSFVGPTAAVGVCAFLVAGIFMNFGFIFMSVVYCTMTHDHKWHWFPRTVASAKALINRPHWTASFGL